MVPSPVEPANRRSGRHPLRHAPDRRPAEALVQTAESPSCKTRRHPTQREIAVVDVLEAARRRMV